MKRIIGTLAAATLLIFGIAGPAAANQGAEQGQGHNTVTESVVTEDTVEGRQGCQIGQSGNTGTRSTETTTTTTTTTTTVYAGQSNQVLSTSTETDVSDPVTTFTGPCNAGQG
jgi:hypothetical protein